MLLYRPANWCPFQAWGPYYGGVHSWFNHDQHRRRRLLGSLIPIATFVLVRQCQVLIECCSRLSDCPYLFYGFYLFLICSSLFLSPLGLLPLPTWRLANSWIPTLSHPDLPSLPLKWSVFFGITAAAGTDFCLDYLENTDVIIIPDYSDAHLSYMNKTGWRFAALSSFFVVLPSGKTTSCPFSYWFFVRSHSSFLFSFSTASFGGSRLFLVVFHKHYFAFKEFLIYY